MNGASRMRMLRRVACGLALGAMVGASAGCELEEGPAYPVVVNDRCVSDEYIATTEPVYYEGRASYWCGGVWYYRDGGRWGHYDREPPGLRGRRMEPVRRNYEPSFGRGEGRREGRPEGRPGGPGGHPGGRPGHH